MIETNYLRANLAPVPEVIQKNLLSHLSQRPKRFLRTLLYLDPLLTANLWARGAFSELNVIGVLTEKSMQTSVHFTGLPGYSIEDLSLLNADWVVLTDYKRHSEIARKLSRYAKQFGFQILDLCSGFNEISFRREWSETLKENVLCNAIPISPIERVEVWIPSQWGLGDKLCALSTARELARRNPKWQIQFQHIPEIVSAYEDDLVTSGSGGFQIPYQEPFFYRERDSSIAANYLGCYYLNAGLFFSEAPSLELPKLPAMPGLEPGSYIALQPAAGWARPNIGPRQLEDIVRSASMPVVVVGRQETPRNIKGAIYEYLGSPLDMLRVIQHAAIMLAPRSASAHIASAYRTPSIIWVPDDGENWHLNYPGWQCKMVRVRQRGIRDWIIREMSSFKPDTQECADGVGRIRE